MGKRAFKVIKLGYRICQYDIVTKTAAIFLLMSGLIAETIFYNRKYSQRGLTNYHLQTLYSALSFITGSPLLRSERWRTNCTGKQDMMTVLQQDFND